jgi:diguanylate cyclase (GGDEF)-like protein
VARLGGDEFAILIRGLHALSASEHLAERFTQAMQEPVVCAGIDLRSSASLGIAVGRSGVDLVDHVVVQADMAMYEAKRSGGACYRMARSLKVAA